MTRAVRLTLITVMLATGLSAAGCVITVQNKICTGIKLSESMTVEALVEQCYGRVIVDAPVADALREVNEVDRQTYFAQALQHQHLTAYAEGPDPSVVVWADEQQALYFNVLVKDKQLTLICALRSDVPAVWLGSLPTEVLLDGIGPSDGKVIPIKVKSGGRLFCTVVPAGS